MHLDLEDQTQLYLGLFEREAYPWLMRLSRHIRTAVDIGAAQGEYTLFLLLKTEATAVYAFEPDAGCLELLTENLRLNGAARSGLLQISTKFVGDSDDDRRIRLDSFLGPIHSPCFIKVDVDGAEELVLRGAELLNRLADVRWLIETHSRELEISCVRILSQAGFQTRIIPNASWRVAVPELRPCRHNRWLAAWKRACA